jgi:CarboxypepD_reg-like domain
VFKKKNLKINLNKIRLRITLSEFMILRILLFLFSFSVFAQKTLITGQILDKATAEPIPYASVRVKNTYIGTVADSLGKYALKVNQQKDILVFSSVGYFDKVIDLKKNKLSDFTIQMEVNKNDLSEIIIKPDENPAWKIVRKVLENRNLNNPDKYETYQARTHSKLELMLEKVLNRVIDSTKTKQRKKANNIIFEYAGDIYHQKPGKKKETIFATHTNFLKIYSNLINVIPLDLHKYHFYEELYNFYPLERIYVNPINTKTFKQYEWELNRIDTTVNDTIYYLKFKPYKGQKFNGFEGNITINSDGFAIEEIHLKSADSTQNIEIDIFQKYHKIQDKWFTKRAETRILTYSKDEKIKGLIEGILITDFKDVKINTPLNSKIFDDVQRELLPGSGKYNDSTFAAFRIDSLSSKEKKMYEKPINETKLTKIIEKIDAKYSDQLVDLSIGIIDIKIAEINLLQGIGINFIEGVKLQVGIQSTLIKKPRFGFHIIPSYGFRDKRFKLNTDFSWFITKDRYNRITLGYKNSYESNINSNYLLGSNLMLNYDFQQMPNSATDLNFIKVNQIESKFAALYVRPLKYNWVRFQLEQTNYNGLNANILNNKNPYNLTELSVHWRLAYKEVINRTGRLETRINRFYPIVNFRVTKGLDLWQSSHQYWKFFINNDFQIRYKKVGITNLKHFGTYATGGLPTDFLQPSIINRIRIDNLAMVAEKYTKSNSQEILNSTFQFEHDFNNILFKPKTKYSKPRIAVQGSINSTKLSLAEVDMAKTSYNFTSYTAGISIRNILKIPIRGVSIGLGGSIVYSFGPNAPSTNKERIRLGFRLF